MERPNQVIKGGLRSSVFAERGPNDFIPAFFVHA
jgi:hypothetical protein